MRHAKVGRSNLTVSRICLGTMHFGPYASETEAHRIMDRALELGINFFDTANVYGGAGDRGQSERMIGTWFAAEPSRRERVVLATKVYQRMTDAEIPNEEPGM